MVIQRRAPLHTTADWSFLDFGLDLRDAIRVSHAKAHGAFDDAELGFRRHDGVAARGRGVAK